MLATDSQTEQPTGDHAKPWQTIDGWFVLTSILGGLAAAYAGWALEDLSSLRTVSNLADLDALRPHVLPVVFSFVSCLCAIILLVYSTASILWRIGGAAICLILLTGSFVLAFGILRTSDAVTVYEDWLRFYYIKGLPAVPLSFFLASWWLQNIFGPVKFMHRAGRVQQKAVDVQFPVTRLHWVLSLSMLVFVWLSFQFPSAVTNSDYFVPSIVGAALAVAIYVYLNVISLLCHIPAGRILATIFSWVLFGALAGGLYNSGAVIFKRMLLAERYLDAIVAVSIVACMSLAVWSTVVFLIGRVPRRLKAITAYKSSDGDDKSAKTVSSMPWCAVWSNRRRILTLSATGLLVLLTAHYLPRYMDLPLTLCQDGSSYPNAKLVTEVRRLVGSLRYSEAPRRIQSRILLDSHLETPAVLRITSVEFDDPRWQKQIQIWQDQQRMPEMDGIDQIHTAKQLEFFGVANETINGNTIDPSQVNLAAPIGGPAWEGVTIVDTHVTQQWIDFLSQFSTAINFQGCTFEPELKLPASVYRVTYSGKITDQQHLQDLLRPQLMLDIVCSNIEDIQIPAVELKQILIRSGIRIFDQNRQDPEPQAVSTEELKTAAAQRLAKHFQQLGYLEEDIQLLREKLRVDGSRWALEKLEYGSDTPLPKNADRLEFKTDESGNLIRLTMLPTSYYHTTNLRITPDLLAAPTLEILEFDIELFQLLHLVKDFPQLRVLRFVRKENLDLSLTRLRQTIEELLRKIDQENLEELELVWDLEQILEHCEPWPNMKSLAVILSWPPSKAATDQIKTAKNLQQLIICHPDDKNWNQANLAQRKKQWQQWLEQNQITLPTRLVSYTGQMGKERTTDAEDADSKSEFSAPAFEFNTGTTE